MTATVHYLPGREPAESTYTACKTCKGWPDLAGLTSALTRAFAAADEEERHYLNDWLSSMRPCLGHDQ